MSNDEAIAAGLAAVTAAAHELKPPVACRDVGRVFDTAIEHGAPIWNAGSEIGCAQIYLQTARDLLATLRALGAPPAGDVSDVLDALQEVLTEFPDATPENANQLGWTLRGVFDRFHMDRGIEDVDQLIVATRAAGGAVDVDLVSLCLTVAIAHGNSLYPKSLAHCAVLHDHTARQVLKLLVELERNGGSLTPGLSRVRRELAPIVAAYPRLTQANVEMAAWKLYEAFLRILEFAPKEAARSDATECHGFISYRRAGGADAALALRAYLQMRGLNSFLDVEGLTSGEFGPRLLQAIEQAPAFLLILTPDSLDRCQHADDWVRVEIVHALETKRTIIPIFKDGFRFPPAATLPTEIRALIGYHAVTYSHEYFGAVIDRIEKYMRSAMAGLA